MQDALSSLLRFSTQPSEIPIVIDGGAHHGVFTESVFESFPAANIIAYEPDPDTFEHLVRRMGKASKATLKPLALSDRCGHAEFFRGARTATNSLLPRPEEENTKYYPADATLTPGTQVKTTTIDQEILDHGLERVHLLKLDLQGAELAALKGAQECLSRQAIDIIYAEVVFTQKYRNQPLMWEVWGFLNSYGYTLLSIEDVKVGPYDPVENNVQKQQWNQADAIFISEAYRQKTGG